MNARPVLLVVGDAAVPTGFSRVVESVIGPLAAQYEIHQLAVNYCGDPHPLRWRLYPALAGGDKLGVRRVRELIRRVRPDLVFTVGDPWVQAEYLREIFAEESSPPVVTYTPVDAGPLLPKWLEDAHRVRRFAVYTEDARSEVLAVRPELDNVIVMPHGVDAESFFPTNRTEARERVGLAQAVDDFIVLNANRNQPRKRLDITMTGFASFARDKPESVKLLLHTGLVDLGWDLRELGQRLGIGRRLILSGPPSGGPPSVEVATLNAVYNACDVGVNTSGAEGWGLVAFEHASTGKPQIVPDHATLRELWGDAAVRLPVGEVHVQPGSLAEFRFTTPEAVASALETFYRSPRLREELGERCREVASRPEFSWARIAARWGDVFASALASKGDEPSS